MNRHRLLWLLPVPVLLGSLLVGPRGGIPLPDILARLTSPGTLLSGVLSGGEALAGDVLLGIRLPRILLAFLTGASLTVSGSVLQALVRNPLVSPDILGLSAGAACGAALALAVPGLPLQTTAFVFGLAGALASYRLARTRHGTSMLSLVLAGVVVSALFTAFLTVIQVFSDPFRLQTIVHWTMGNLHNASWEKVRSAAVPMTAGSVVLVLRSWRLNVLALGDTEAGTAGLDPEREKLLQLIPAALVASAAVSVAGIIGMVGLVVPHLVRIMVGPDNVRTVPASIALGGCFLVLVDDLSRSTTAYELPAGVFTTLVGVPVFMLLLRRYGSRFGE